MPEVTDPNVLRRLQAPQAVEAQPFPGTSSVQRNPARVASEQQSAQRSDLDLQQNNRAAAQVEMERQRLLMTQEDADRQRNKAAAAGGFESS